LLVSIGLDAVPLTVGGAGGALTAAGGAAVLGHRLSTRGRIRARYGPGGWITHRELRVCLGTSAVREKALRVRPSLATLTREQRRKLPDAEFGVTIGRTVTGPPVPRWLHFTHEDVCFMVAPPRMGKTSLFGNWIIDHPGAVVATSTKTDTHRYTAALRADRGTVWVFNPEQLGGLASTFRWSPVDGCADPGIAQERAGYLVSGASAAGDVRDGAWFEQKAVGVLRAYLLAAALGKRTMSEVAKWATAPSDNTAVKILKDFPHVVPGGWIAEMEHLRGSAADRTRESIYLTLGLAVAFMGNPDVARVCTPGPDEPSFDVREFVNGRQTLHIIGEERQHSPIAPLLCALTGHVFEECKRLAAYQPDGRLDPPVLFALDEAALIVPVPLPRWTSDAGGRGITLAVAVQALSQLEERWHRTGAATIRNNAGVKLYLGGLTEPADLEAVSVVCGEREEDSVTDNLDDGARTPRSVTRRLTRTITADRVRMLPEFYVLVVYRTARPVIARIRPVWGRTDVQAHSAHTPVVGTADRVESAHSRVS
ncbi:MAG: type IV secretory system conjugative DNA transfer family protein, partial [Pseudonocardiaceae bacterium]